MVMRNATASFSSSRRQIGSAPRAGISSINPSRSSLLTTLSAAPPLRLGAFNGAVFPLCGGGQQPKLGAAGDYPARKGTTGGEALMRKLHHE